jgi:hypothetical protein
VVLVLTMPPDHHPIISAVCYMSAQLADRHAEAPIEARDGLQMIFRLGRLAFEAGTSLTSNPQPRPSAGASAWASGWHAGKRRTFVAQRSR